ncbi:hypothetical protein BRD18_03425 [Halobacteriales archaeon SW_7_71_33]|nr:MAG: hypothetical protein BRD18_03425 [Halobacteriales archaeon SW_7_71_33]
MELPGIVADELGEGETIATAVSLGGDDRLFVTPECSLVYRAGGVLSDESVESLSHDVERLTLSEGRRKATFGLEYAVDPDRQLAVPLDRVEAVLQPLLAAVLRAGGVTTPGERVHRVFSFSELTLVVTDERLFKHVGAALWDDDHEAIPFDVVTDLSYEEGSVATGVVLTVDGRVERMKTPNDRLPEVREVVESALLAARDADSVADLGDDTNDASTVDPGAAVADFGGVDALDAGADDTTDDASPATDTDTDAPEPARPDAHGTTEEANPSEGWSPTDGKADETETDTPFTESVAPAPEEALQEELAELRAAVERQNELLRRHNDAVERLVETLRES